MVQPIIKIKLRLHQPNYFHFEHFLLWCLMVPFSLGFQTPNHGDLTGWARQGVLLLNACLTVRQANANSHSGKGWEQITDAVVRHISTHCRGVVFLLWGAYAQKKAAVVDGKKHHLLKSVHPSPLSAHRGFLGCKHFSKCNELLEKEGKIPIDWAKL